MKKNIPENPTTETAVNKSGFLTSFFALVFGIVPLVILMLAFLGFVKFCYTTLCPTLSNRFFSNETTYKLEDMLRAEGQTPSANTLLENNLPGAYTEDGGIVYLISEHEIAYHRDTVKGAKNDDGGLTSVGINASDVSYLSELPEGNLYMTEECDGLLLDYHGRLFVVYDDDCVFLLTNDGNHIGFNGEMTLCYVRPQTRD